MLGALQGRVIIEKERDREGETDRGREREGDSQRKISEADDILVTTSGPVWLSPTIDGHKVSYLCKQWQINEGWGHVSNCTV